MISDRDRGRGRAALGVLAYFAVRDATGSVLLGGLAFLIGLLALLLGHSELFTEDFLMPFTTVVRREAGDVGTARQAVGRDAGDEPGGRLLVTVVRPARSTDRATVGGPAAVGADAR